MGLLSFDASASGRPLRPWLRRLVPPSLMMTFSLCCRGDPRGLPLPRPFIAAVSSMALPSSPAQPGLPEIWQELRALRLELAQLRQSLESRADVAPAAAGEAPLEPAKRDLERPDQPPSTLTLLARRNGERLQQEVRRRLERMACHNDDATVPGDDTEVDLLIDRLHDLADASSREP